MLLDVEVTKVTLLLDAEMTTFVLLLATELTIIMLALYVELSRPRRGQTPARDPRRRLLSVFLSVPKVEN